MYETRTRDYSSWTSVGAQDSAQDTYAAVKNAINQSSSLKNRNIEVFLQGSYANSTNIRGDSDVDVVVMCSDTFSHEVEHLPSDAQARFHRDYGPPSYTASQLRSDIQNALVSYFGAGKVQPKDKCIRVTRQSQVDADVVPALEYRLYRSYQAPFSRDYVEGIAIHPLSRGRIVNFPKEHISNGEGKSRATGQTFKPTVRQFKRLKHEAVQQGSIDQKDMPGYVLECLVYNVHNNVFSSNHNQRFLSVLDWLLRSNWSNFSSVDNIHTLFGTDPGNFDLQRTFGVFQTIATHA